MILAVSLFKPSSKTSFRVISGSGS
jgi:hypothetical protein